MKEISWSELAAMNIARSSLPNGGWGTEPIGSFIEKNINVMDRVYKEIRGSVVRFDGYQGIVCGYSDGRYLAATETKPECSFRKIDKGTTIEDDFKDSKYRYFYLNEADMIKQQKL